MQVPISLPELGTSANIVFLQVIVNMYPLHFGEKWINLNPAEFPKRICPPSISGGESEKVLLYLYTLRPFSLSPLNLEVSIINFDDIKMRI